MGRNVRKQPRLKTPHPTVKPVEHSRQSEDTSAFDPTQMDSAKVSAQSIFDLQRKIGNRGMQNLLARKTPVQQLNPGGGLQRVDAPALGDEVGVAEAEPSQPTLRQGSSGPSVTMLQEKLNNAGTNPPLETDGIFGPMTRNAVVAFQSQNDLAPDGIVGPATWGKLNETSAGGNEPPDTTVDEDEATDEVTTDEPTEEQPVASSANLDEFLQNQVITQAGERFDVVYLPSDVSGPDVRPVVGRAIFVLKLHLTFLNADDTPAQEPELSAGAPDDRDQVWSLEEQAEFRTNMASVIETAWSGQHQMICETPGFEPLTTDVEIDVQFVDDPADAHNKVTVHKGGPDDPRFRSFVQGDRSEFDSRDATEPDTFEVFRLNRFTGPFGHGRADLTPEMTGQLDAIADEINALPPPSVEEDGTPEPHEIQVVGRATASGSDDFNLGLSQERADNVVSYLAGKVNTATFTANAEGEVGPGDDTRSNEDPKYRRADIFVDPFESQQLTAAHEAGHMFGLGDEYVDMDTGVRRLVGEADSPADDELLNDEFAEIPAGDTDSIMSMGSVVHSAHYAPFALKLEKATNLNWTVP